MFTSRKSSCSGGNAFVFSVTVLLIIFCACPSNAEKSHSTTSKCSASEIDKFDEITARYLSLTEYQRKFPETSELIPEYCK